MLDRKILRFHALVLGLLLLTNLLPLIQNFVLDAVQTRHLLGLFILGGLLYWAYNQREVPWFALLLGLVLASLVGLPAQAQSTVQRAFHVQGGLCEWWIPAQSRRIYKVTDWQSGYSIRVVTGKDRLKNPAACGSTEHYFPVMAPFNVRIQKVKIDSLEAISERYRDILEGRQGNVVLLFIPSLKRQSLEIPMQIRSRSIVFPEGDLPARGLTVERVSR